MIRLTALIARILPPLGETAQSSGLSAPLPALDGLRALAFGLLALSALPAAPAHGLDQVLGRLSIGMDLFLVVMAYGTARLLIFERRRTGQLSLRNYLMRKLLRIVPVTLFLTAPLLAWAVWFQGWPAIADAVGVFTFTQNVHEIVSEAPPAGPISHLWFLSALMQYFLVLPVLAAVAVGSRRSFAVIASAWLVLSLAFSFILAVEGRPAAELRWLAPFRPEAILAGVSIAVFEAELWKFRRKRLAILVLGVLSLLLLSKFRFGGLADWQDVIVIYTHAVLAALILAVALMYRPAERIFSILPLIWLGRMFPALFIAWWPAVAFSSYAVETAGLFPDSLWMPWFLISCLAVFITLIAASIAWYGIERRVGVFRRHYEFIEGRPMRL